MAQRHEFGRPLDDPDLLVIQGVEYTLNSLGMRAMRRVLTERRVIALDMASTNVEVSSMAGEKMLDLMVDLLVSSVIPDQREQLREQIEESMGPSLVGEVAAALLGSMSDLPPTRPGSSLNGSSPTGPTSTAGADPTASTSAS